MEILIYRALAAPQPRPDLSPMDFALFPYLKSKLHGQRFSDLNNVRYDIKDILQNCDKYWCERAFYKLVNGMKSVRLKKVFTLKEVTGLNCLSVISRHLTSWKYKIVLRKSNSCKLKVAVSFESNFKTI